MAITKPDTLDLGQYNLVAGDTTAMIDKINGTQSDLDTFGTQLNTMVTDIENEATVIAQETRALTAEELTCTSTTSVTIGTGAKSWVIELNKDYVVGQTVKMTDAANVNNFMKGLVTAYNSGTGAFDLDITATGGSGTISDWSGIIESSGLSALADDTTPQLGGDLDCNTHSITNGKLGSSLDCNGQTINDSAVRQIADASLGTGTHTFDYANGDMQQLTATGNITLAFSNLVTGNVCAFIVDAVNFGAHVITHPVGIQYAAGTAPTYTAAGTDRLLILSDKDAVLTLHVVDQDIKA